MSTFTLAISCLTTSTLPWFMDLIFQVPMQYCSWQHQTLLLSRHIHYWVLFLLWLHPFILSGVISPLISNSILAIFMFMSLQMHLSAFFHLPRYLFIYLLFHSFINSFNNPFWMPNICVIFGARDKWVCVYVFVFLTGVLVNQYWDNITLTLSWETFQSSVICNHNGLWTLQITKLQWMVNTFSWITVIWKLSGDVFRILPSTEKEQLSKRKTCAVWLSEHVGQL